MNIYTVLLSLGLGLKTEFFSLGLSLVSFGLGLELCGIVNTNTTEITGHQYHF